MKHIPIITAFKWHGHTPDETGNDRDERGSLRCQKCGESAGSELGYQICPMAEMIHIEVHELEINKLMEASSSKGGRKVAKKVNKIYRKELQSRARYEAENLMRTFEEHLRPAPRWIPEKLWAWGQRLFIRI